MRKFYSQNPVLKVSHPTLKTAAGNPRYIVKFIDHRFQTENEALADALAALPLAGVSEEVEPKPAEEPTEEPVSEPEKVVRRGPNRR